MVNEGRDYYTFQEAGQDRGDGDGRKSEGDCGLGILAMGKMKVFHWLGT